MASAVTVLPEPDSPTRPTVWPGSSWNDAPSTALTQPALVENETVRLSTCSSVTQLLLPDRGAVGAQRLGQTVAEEREREHGDGDRRTWDVHQVRRLAHIRVGGRQHGAPRGRGRLHAQAEEAEARLDGDGDAEEDGDLHHHRRDRIGKHVAQHD